MTWSRHDSTAAGLGRGLLFGAGPYRVLLSARHDGGWIASSFHKLGDADADLFALCGRHYAPMPSEEDREWVRG